MFKLSDEDQRDLVKQLKAELIPEFEILLRKVLSENSNQKEFLTRKETAAFFSISLVCLHDWMRKGIVTPLKCGNRTYFHRPTIVQQLFDSNRRRFFTDAQNENFVSTKTKDFFSRKNEKYKSK